MTEKWFGILGIVMVVGSLVVGGFAATTESTEASPWSPDIPALEPVNPAKDSGEVMLNGTTYDSLQTAIDAAEAGQTIEVAGYLEEAVTIDTADLTIRPRDDSGARIDGDGHGTVVTIDAENVRIEGVQVTGSGEQRSSEDAGILVNGSGSVVEHVRIADVTYGIWVSSAKDVELTDNEITGNPDLSAGDRGNSIHLFEADGAEVTDNAMTGMRDGIRYQWSSDVIAANNTMWDLRYGVHYMYSDDNVLDGNLAFKNDVGFALMVSENLTITDNLAIDNRHGPSRHGILVKDIDDSTIAGNDLVNNGNGLYVYNAQNNVITDNLVLTNGVGIHYTAGSQGEAIAENSFIHNERAAHVTATASQSVWNNSERGNYWSDARTVDMDGDGTSEVRYRPAGTVESLMASNPDATTFAESPAFDAIRLAEDSFPVLATRGIVDYHPLTESPHDHWEEYYENHR